MDMAYTVVMTTMGERTKINSSTVVTGNGMIAKSMLVFMAGSLKKQEDRNLANLKRAIEANTKEYFPK